MSTSKRIEEALEHIRQAEKRFGKSMYSRAIRQCIFVFSLKTGLLKWRPDYDIACDEYQKAGK